MRSTGGIPSQIKAQGSLLGWRDPAKARLRGQAADPWAGAARCATCHAAPAHRAETASNHNSSFLSVPRTTAPLFVAALHRRDGSARGNKGLQRVCPARALPSPPRTSTDLQPRWDQHGLSVASGCPASSGPGACSEGWRQARRAAAPRAFPSSFLNCAGQSQRGQTGLSYWWGRSRSSQHLIPLGERNELQNKPRRWRALGSTDQLRRKGAAHPPHGKEAGGCSGPQPLSRARDRRVKLVQAISLHNRRCTTEGGGAWGFHPRSFMRPKEKNKFLPLKHTHAQFPTLVPSSTAPRSLPKRGDEARTTDPGTAKAGCRPPAHGAASGEHQNYPAPAPGEGPEPPSPERESSATAESGKQTQLGKGAALLS